MPINKAMADVRMATPADLDPLIELLREMHAETGIGRFDPERAQHAVVAGISRKGGVVGVVRSSEGIVEASIGLFIGLNWYSSDPHLFDLWSFVGEPYRKTTHAKLLIGFAKSAALDLGLPLMMTLITNERTQRKERLFERQMPKAGSVFAFNVGPPPAHV